MAPLHQIEPVARRTGPEYLLACAEAGRVQAVDHSFEIVGAQIGQEGEAAVMAFVYRIFPRREPGCHDLIEGGPNGRIESHQFVQIGFVEHPQIGVAGGRCVVCSVLASEQTHFAKEAACANPVQLLHNALGVLGCKFSFACIHQIEGVPRLACPIGT